MIFRLFSTFFKIGLFTFGGGYAMIPLIENEIIHEKKWIDEDELLEIVSVAQMTPGTIAVNSATFVGYRIAGVSGSLAASLGVILPSFFIITIIVIFLAPYFKTQIIKSAFMGVKSCVIALILFAVVKIFKKSVKNKITLFIFTASFLTLFFSLLSPIKIIISGAVFGIFFYILFPLKMSGYFEKENEK